MNRRRLSLAPRSGSDERTRLGPFYGLLTRSVQRARLRAALPLVDPEGPVLDVGCGLTGLPGILPAYVGCDRNQLVLETCRRRHPSSRFISWDVGSAEPPEELKRAGPFQTVLMLALLEHVASPERALRRVAALTAGSGRIVLTTPHPASRAALRIGALLGLLSPHADEEHEDLLGRARLERIAAEAGLSVALFRQFLFGLNQLAVLRPRGAGSR